MRILTIGLIAVSSLFISTTQAQNKTGPVQLKDRQDSISYIIGRDVGGQLKTFGTKIKMNAFSAGVDQAIKGQKSLIDTMRADSLRREFSAEVSQRMQKHQDSLATTNKKEADAFFAKNKKEPGVKTTASGLQYKMLTKGNGPKPKATDSVQVTYKGTFLNGTVFDSSSSGPVSLNLERIIPGLKEGLQLMNTGSKYRFYIPPQLAYGEQGIPPNIPPNSALIFDIQLVKILGGSQGGANSGRKF